MRDFKKVIIVFIGDMALCPPALSITQCLLDLGINVVIATTESKIELHNKFDGDPLINYVGLRYEDTRNVNLVKKLLRMVKIRKRIWDTINKHYDESTLIWCISDISLKHIGNKILSKTYVLHLLELEEDLRYYQKIPFLKFDKRKIGNSAYKIVVSEYNRAHITKAWWGLDKLPIVLENKPYIKKNIEKKAEITNSDIAKNVISKLSDKKIILYQGIIHKERQLNEFISAVDMLGEEYAFILMSNGENVYENIKSSNFYFIPFVEPPYHLEITSHAYIGILSYFPTESQYSILNAVYCAPNKTFEYSMFGIPMLSNDLPALRYLFDTENCGLCIEDFNTENIIKAIKTIELNYENLSRNARLFYNSVDIKNKIGEHIL